MVEPGSVTLSGRLARLYACSLQLDLWIVAAGSAVTANSGASVDHESGPHGGEREIAWKEAQNPG